MSNTHKSEETDFYSQIPEAAADSLLSIKNSIGQGFCISDANGKIRDVNQYFAAWLGYDEREMLQRQFSDYIYEKLRPYARLHQQEFFLPQKESRTEVWDFVDFDGKIIPLEVLSSRIKLGESIYKMDILKKTDVKRFPIPNHDDSTFKENSRHLFKNTLQEINGLLQLQSVHLQGEERDIFNDAQKRTETITLAFDQLYKLPIYNEIALGAYLVKILEMHHIPKGALQEHPELSMNIHKCYALGLILTEILLKNNGSNEGISLSGRVIKGDYFFKLYHAANKGQITLTGFGDQLVKALLRQLMAEPIEDNQKNTLLNLRIPL